MWIKVDDTVEVLAGDDAGTRGRVLRINREKNKVVVEHVNRVYKHVRRSQKNPQGGRLSMEMPVDCSNVALVCESCGAATRVGARFLDDGAKERFCKKCGAAAGSIAPAKKQHAKKA